MKRNHSDKSIMHFSMRFNDAMPRRAFLKKVTAVSLGFALFRTVFSDRALAAGIAYTPKPCGGAGGVTLPTPCNDDPDCGNGGFQPNSAFQTTDPKCCKCALLGNGCPPGTSPAANGLGYWGACCTCDKNTNSGDVGKEYWYQDCCATDPSGNPGIEDDTSPQYCPYDPCFTKNVTVQWFNPAHPGFPKLIQCATGSAGGGAGGSWCNTRDYGTISTPKACCEIS